jgi:hypothetical protein
MPRRSHRLPIRLSDSELSKIRGRAAACGRPVARFVRECALGAIPRALRRQPTDDLIHTLSQIVRLLVAEGAAGAADNAPTRQALVARLMAMLDHLTAPEP